MKYLQDAPVQRFQAGGMSGNPEGDYYGGGEEDPAGPPKTQPDRGRKRTPYGGNKGKLLATLGMLSKVMKGLGMAKQAGQALSEWQSPDGIIEMYNEKGGKHDYATQAAKATSLATFAMGNLGFEVTASMAKAMTLSIGELIALNAGKQVAAASGTGIAVEISGDAAAAAAAAEGSFLSNLSVPNPAIIALVYLGTKVAEMLTPDQTPFSLQKLNFMKGRGGDNEATYNKLMEAGFNGEDSLIDVIGDVVRTPQDYYEFRDKYFVGDFENTTFRKDS